MYTISDVDRATLPTALLELVKAQLRVTFDDEDAVITDMTMRAINLIEHKTGLSIFAATGTWTPDVYDTWTAQGVLCPLLPFSEDWTATNADGDVTALYAVHGNTVGQYLYHRDNLAVPSGSVTLTLHLGYDDIDDIPPALLDIILRTTATLFENRQSTTDVSLESVPMFADDLMVGHWVPRA